MAPKGQKRAAAEMKKGAAMKKTRGETDAAATHDTLMSTVVEAIEVSDTLPQTCRSMLITGIRGSLCTASDERHEVQTLMVGMVDEVIAARDTYLQEAVALAKSAEATTEASKAELATKLSNAEAALAEKKKGLEEKTLANAAALEKMVAANALHAEKKALQEAFDAAMEEIKQNQTAVSNAIENDLKAILAGKADCQDVLAMLQKLNFDESLIKALPATCGRGTADRGAFDGMVLNQLETSLATKLADLSKEVEAQVPGAKARADEVDAAQEQALAATLLQSKATEEQANAETAQFEAAANVEAASAALAAHAPAEQNAVTLREDKLAAMEEFQHNTRGPFEVLRDAKASAMRDVACHEAKVVSTEAEVDTNVAVMVGGA